MNSDIDYKISNKPLISVIVPNYNNGEWVRDCVNSILDQTYKNIEIIIADDCSTDSSHYIIKEYEKKYPDIIKAVYQKKNKGVSCNRHAAIVASKGEYINTLDADDYYADERKLEKEIELVLEYKQKYNKDVIAFSNIVIELSDGTKSIQGNDNNIVQGDITNRIMCRDCMIPRDFTFLRSSYFEVGEYDTKLPIYEDWDLKIRIAAKYEFYYTGINGTVYRRHGNGLSSAEVPIHIKCLKKIFKKNNKLISKIERSEVERTFNSFISKMKSNYINKISGEIQKNIKNRQFKEFFKNYCMVFMNDKSYLNPNKFRKILRNNLK